MSETVASRLGGALVKAAAVDVGAARERARQRRLRTLAIVLGLPCAFLWYRIVRGDGLNFFQLPPMPNDPFLYIIPIALVLVILLVIAMPLAAGRSPHLEYRPEQIDVALDDVKGLDVIVDEVVKTLNTFLGYAIYRDRLGGSPRRGLLFEGPPGTGKTHLAKAMAREAGVPFLFVSATSFQSMWYGATARKIRSYFRALRRTARREGGAIGFIEEIDAIATTRSGMRSVPMPDHLRTQALGCHTSTSPSALGLAAGRADAPMAVAIAGEAQAGSQRAGALRLDRAVSESAGGVVNELLIQLQSFDTPPFPQRVRNGLAGWLNGYLPAHLQISKRKSPYHNILVIAATNRADNLDPALVRPGRFDRLLSFDLPAKGARRQIIDHFLGRKSHAEELDAEDLRDQLAGQTLGYTPVMIEHLLDESLVLALKAGRDEMSWTDIQEARLTGEVGLKNPVPYTSKERRTVATHEAGHATVAFLAGTRKLEVLSIIKRREALGLLAHGDPEEVYTRTKGEMLALIDIALGGLVAEELFFGEAGTGPAGDLAAATRLAAEAVGASGMAGSLVSMAAVENGAINQTNLVGRVLADKALRDHVDRLLNESKQRVREDLDRNRHLVEALRDALLERDELIGDEITDVLRAAGPVGDDLRVVHEERAAVPANERES